MAHRILLADDSLTIQKVVELTFSESEYELMTVGDGDKAVAALDSFKPDIVLADVVMPGFDGYTVCETVKSRPEGAFIPVVLLTGTFERFDRARAERVGCDSIVTKPFDSHALANQVADLLRKAEAARAAHAAAPETTSQDEMAWEPAPAEPEAFAVEPEAQPEPTPAAYPSFVEPEPEPEPAAVAQPVSILDAPDDAMYATTALRIPSPAELEAIARQHEAAKAAASTAPAATAAEAASALLAPDLRATGPSAAPVGEMELVAPPEPEAEAEAEPARAPLTITDYEPAPLLVLPEEEPEPVPEPALPEPEPLDFDLAPVSAEEPQLVEDAPAATEAVAPAVAPEAVPAWEPAAAAEPEVAVEPEAILEPPASEPAPPDEPVPPALLVLPEAEQEPAAAPDEPAIAAPASLVEPEAAPEPFAEPAARLVTEPIVEILPEPDVAAEPQPIEEEPVPWDTVPEDEAAALSDQRETEPEAFAPPEVEPLPAAAAPATEEEEPLPFDTEPPAELEAEVFAAPSLEAAAEREAVEAAFATEEEDEDLPTRRDIEEDIAAYESSGRAIEPRREVWEHFDDAAAAERAVGSGAEGSSSGVGTGDLEALAATASLTDLKRLIPAAPAAPPEPYELTDADVDRIARRVVELMTEKAVREIAWEIVPEMAERFVKERIEELEKV